LLPDSRRPNVRSWSHLSNIVLSHFPETRDWIRACRPEGKPPGFVLPNLLHRTEPCAGLELQPRVLGARAAENHSF
jgi:LacI family transcriptional regulator